MFLGVYVLFLKSLFCLSGSDNRSRFMAIHISCYFLFAITSSIFSFSGTLTFLTLCLFTAISTFSTKRRLIDASLKIKWLYALTGSFIITGLVIIISGYSSSYWLLFLPFVISLFLMTYKSKEDNHILGYLGDIDLSGYIKQDSFQNQTRIEPTFNQDRFAHSNTSVNQNNKSTFINNENFSENPNSHGDNDTSVDIGETIRLRLFDNKKVLLTVSILVLLVTMAMTLTSIISPIDGDENITPLENKTSPAAQLEQLSLHEVTLPDGFSLSTTPFNGITLKWQGEATTEELLWQQLTAQGDQSCKAITYNNGKTVRTFSVIQENNGDYLANFSPLDTKVIIRNIAIRSSFTLCGYKFSLKGSQSVLGKHSYYSKFISN